jgi:DMSO/TMAO reductase YedYZ molybdopterin-dependent catalytic subunit
VDATRRRFLEASAGAAIAAILPLPAERVLGTLPFVGEGSFPVEETVGAGLGRRRMLDLSTLSRETLVTPTHRFFIRTGRPDRLPPTIRLHGLVKAPLEIDAQALKGEAEDQGAHLLECAGNSRAGHFGLISAARWTGVPLLRVLERVSMLPGAARVLVSGFDEHSVLDPGSVPGASWIFGLDDLRGSGAFLATAMNGDPLAPDHGAPVRLVVPGWYGCTAIKWVNEIALVDDAAAATDQMLEYAGRTAQDPSARLAREFQPATIDPAAVPVRVERIAGGVYRVVGIAWGGRSPARGLEIRVDPDPAFVPVEPLESGAGRTWALWSYTFRPRAAGRRRIEMALDEPSLRARRLEVGYYTREIDIPESDVTWRRGGDSNPRYRS